MSDFEILIRNSDQELPWTTLDEYLQVIVAENDKLTDMLMRILQESFEIWWNNENVLYFNNYIDKDIQEWWQSQKDKKC